MMIIAVEGVLGAGKTMLVQRIPQHRPCVKVYCQDSAMNPFLQDFYRDRKRYSLHTQTTFLFLQERIYKDALARSRQGDVVVCDFHPLKSLIFASVVLKEQEEALRFLRHLYQLLHIPQPDLVIYLKADVHTLLARLRQRNDPYREEIDFTYMVQLCEAYDRFFRTYAGPFMLIDTTHADYVSQPELLSDLLQQVPYIGSDS
jgi:deoxyadenosine/deoxycytidine kinase